MRRLSTSLQGARVFGFMGYSLPANSLYYSLFAHLSALETTREFRKFVCKIVCNFVTKDDLNSFDKDIQKEKDNSMSM